MTDITASDGAAGDDSDDEAPGERSRGRGVDRFALLPRPQLSRRVARLEAEMAEYRRLNLRLAELTDVVQELLIPLAQSHPEKVTEILDRYRDELGS